MDTNWGNIDLTSIIERERIEELQAKVVHEIVNEGYKIAGSYERVLITSLGVIEQKVIKLRNGDGIVSPLPGILGIRRRKRSNEIKIKLADMASVASYGKSSRTFRSITGISVPKSTIHGQEVGNMIELNGSVNKNSVIEPDGTEAHSTGQSFRMG